MFCRKCGNEIPEDSLFCPKCGAATGESITPAGEADIPQAESAESQQAESQQVEIQQVETTEYQQVEIPQTKSREVDKNAFALTYEFKSSYDAEKGAAVIVRDKPRNSKKTLIIILSIIGVLIVAGVIIFIVNANKDEYPDFKYHLADDDTYIIDGYKGNEPNIVIPDEMYEKPVTRIGNYAFQNSAVESVSFGSHMKALGEGAFKDSAIKSVTFERYIPPEAVTAPDDVLDSLTITIGDFAFYGCKNLSEFNFPYDNLASIGTNAFCYTESLKSITLASVSEMGDSAFAGSGLETALIGGNLGTSAFEDCKSLREFTIRTITTELTPRIFANCSALETLNWNCNIYRENSIPQDAFEGCTELRQIVFGGETATYPRQISEIINKYGSLGAKQITFNDFAFKDCKYFKNPAEPQKPVEQPKPQISANTAVDIAKLTYGQVVEKFGMPDYYFYAKAEYDDMEIGYSERVYAYNDGSKCFNKNNSSRIDYVILYGDKKTIIDSALRNMHLGEGLDYYSQFMDFDVYDAFKLGSGDHGAMWYELSYQYEKNGVVQYYATIRFLPDTYISYAVKVEYVGY